MNPAATKTSFISWPDRGRQYRSQLTFNTSGLPDDAIVTAVKLKIKSAGVVGSDPLNNRRSLAVEICTPLPNPAAGHPGVHSSSAGGCDPAGTFGDSPNSGWYTADLLPSSFSSVSLAGATQLRVLISGPTTNGSTRSYFQFFAPDASESDSPILLVKYHVP